jgi:hypothetical protein
MLNGVGVGVVASKKRNIDLSNRFDSYFPKPDYSDPLLIADGSNEMTIDKFIPKMVREFLADTEKIAEYLKQDNIEKTCRAIFDFVYNNIQYTPDSPHEEQIRRPARTWADRKAGVDCDCYSTFISSILYNLRIPHYLRMAAYNPTRGFQHIYVIVPKDNNNLKGSYWTIDPVLDRFNEEKRPMVKVHDKLMKPIGALSVGVNGFPIRMLNGGLDLRSPLVYGEVLYNPSLGTWGLQGIDGGIYIEGDYNRRYVEPLEGMGMGLGWLSTALNVGKGLFKGAKKVVGNIKDRRAAKKAVKAENPELSNKEAKALIAERKAFAQEQANESQQLMNRMQQSTDDALLAEFAGAQADIDTKLKTVNNSTIQSLMQLKKGLESKTDAANKATILSLQTLDKNTKSAISDVVSEYGKGLKDMIDQGASLKDIVEKSKEIGQAALMNTATLNKKDEERTKELITTVENTAMQQQQAITKANNSQKYVLISVGALAVVVLIFMLKGNKQPNIN